MYHILNSRIRRCAAVPAQRFEYDDDDDDDDDADDDDDRSPDSELSPKRGTAIPMSTTE